MNTIPSPRPAETTSISSALRVLAGLLCVGVAVASYRYLFPNAVMPALIASNEFRLPWLVVHAASASTALLIGPWQFWRRVRSRRPRLHRWMGRSYVAACLIGGVSGFVLALGASTGPITTAGFGLLSILWIGSTTAAWRMAVRRDFAGHRRWMIRSFAMTFAAVTLRLYLPVAAALPLAFEDGYRAISFLCWVPNLLAAELYLRRERA